MLLCQISLSLDNVTIDSTVTPPTELYKVTESKMLRVDSIVDGRQQLNSDCWIELNVSTLNPNGNNNLVGMNSNKKFYLMNLSRLVGLITWLHCCYLLQFIWSDFVRQLKILFSFSRLCKLPTTTTTISQESELIHRLHCVCGSGRRRL